MKMFLLKLLRGISLLFGLSVLTFFMMYHSPIDPIFAYLGGDVSITQEQRVALEEYWGLNEPPAEQYVKWFKNFISGDMGVSKIHRRPVKEIIQQKFTASLFDGNLMADFRRGGFYIGNCCGSEQGEYCGSIDQVAGICSGIGADFLVGFAFVDHFFRMVAMVSDRNFGADREKRIGSHPLESYSSHDSSDFDLEYFGHRKCYFTYESQNVGYFK